ncbi:MAG: ATP-binding protein [Shimia sp.]
MAAMTLTRPTRRSVSLALVFLGTVLLAWVVGHSAQAVTSVTAIFGAILAMFVLLVVVRWGRMAAARRAFDRAWWAVPRGTALVDCRGVVVRRNPAARTGDFDDTLSPLPGLTPVAAKVLIRAAQATGYARAPLDRDGDAKGVEVTPGPGAYFTFAAIPTSRTAEDRPTADTGERSAFDQIPVAMLILREDGIVEDANRAASELMGGILSRGKPLDAHLESLGRPVVDWVTEAAEGRNLARSEFLRIAGSDEHAFVQVRLRRLEDASGPRLVAILDDARELKALEAQFIQSQKMQAIGQLAGGIAHDFNNLLTAISGHCDLLVLRRDAAHRDYDDLMQIRQNTNRAASLVRQLLAFSRKQTLRPATIDLEAGLSEMWNLLTRLVGEGIALSVAHEGPSLAVRVDQQQLEQVLMNLVVNAKDAMPDGGAIEVTTCTLDVPEPRREDGARLPAGRYAQITVRDEGTGIPPHRLEKIFEPFFTTKPQGKGTGLGLSTAYGIVKQTGGFIFASSELGKGTSFRILFPAAQGAVEAPDDAPVDVAAEPGPTGERPGVVLLVEDEAPVRAFSARALRLHGYHVLEAETGEEALEVAGAHPGGIDVFVSDVIMPGLDGPAWVEQARAEHPNTSVVFMSGYARDAFKDRGPEVENAAFLAKPFSLQDLVTTIKSEVD